MKPKEDALGQELWALYEGENIYEIVERDDGYIDVLDPKVYFSGYEDWAPFVKKALEHVKGRVLDVGCGAGRHALYLQKRGLM